MLIAIIGIALAVIGFIFIIKSNPRLVLKLAVLWETDMWIQKLANTRPRLNARPTLGFTVLAYTQSSQA
jgi:hypothetical protein